MRPLGLDKSYYIFSLTFSQGAQRRDEPGIGHAVRSGKEGRERLDPLGGRIVDARVRVLVALMSGAVVDPVLLPGHAVGGVGVGGRGGGRHGSVGFASSFVVQKMSRNQGGRRKDGSAMW